MPAQLASQAVDVADALMPAHGAMLALGTTLVAHARRRARPPAPLLDRVLLFGSGLLPTLADGRQRQIPGQAAAAKPDRALRPAGRTGKGDRVAHHGAPCTLRVAWSHADLVFAQSAHELALVPAGDRAGPDDPPERLPRSSLGRVTLNAVVRPRCVSAIRSPARTPRLPVSRARASSRRKPNRCSNERAAFCTRGWS